MSIFDDVKKVTRPAEQPSSEQAVASVVGADPAAHAAGSGMTTVGPNNMGGVTIDDGHGHVDQWLPNNMGGLWHP